LHKVDYTQSCHSKTIILVRLTRETLLSIIFKVLKVLKDSMALKGNLKEFSFTQILNLVNLARKSGGLYIETATQSAHLIFREGKLAFGTLDEKDTPLLEILSKTRLVTTHQVRSLSERLLGQSDKEIGIYLINSGYLSQEQILAGLGDYLSGIVRSCFVWKEGAFHFEIGELPPDNIIPIRLDLENLSVESARQLRETDELKAEIPSLDMTLKFTDRPGLNIRDVNLSPEEWKVVSYINPKNTIAQIAASVQMDDNEVRRVVFALLQGGLVELSRPKQAPSQYPGRIFPTRDPVEQKSLVIRVIDRIKSI
jgi:hypothetical protein